jgi:2'-5' RNA ligase
LTLPLFVAVPLPADIAERLALLGGGVPGARWVPAENMHVTLRYLGELDGMMADDVTACLSGIDAPPFEIAIDGVDHFGSRKEAHVVYAGVQPREPLKRLRDKIEIALQRIGIKADECKYQPHVTLARMRRGNADRVGRFMEANSLMMSQRFRVDAFCLYESIRGRDGAIYNELERYALR